MISYILVQSFCGPTTEDDNPMLVRPRKMAVADRHSCPKETIRSPTGNNFLLVTVDWRIYKKFASDRLDAVDRRELILHVLGNEAGKNIGRITRKNGQIRAPLVDSLAHTAIDAVRERDQTQRRAHSEADAD